MILGLYNTTNLFEIIINLFSNRKVIFKRNGSVANFFNCDCNNFCT